MGPHQSYGESNPRWLASPTWCCAPKHDDDFDDPQEGLVERNVTICYEQPQRVPAPSAEADIVTCRPRTSQSIHRVLANGRDFASRASSRASTARPWSVHHTRQRPSIGNPMDFRHVSTDFETLQQSSTGPDLRRRRSFRPLELSIYLPNSRLSALPDFESCDWSDCNPVGQRLTFPPPARVRSSTDAAVARAPSSAYDFNMPQRKPVSSSFDQSVHLLKHPSSISVDLGRRRSSTLEPQTLSDADLAADLQPLRSASTPILAPPPVARQQASSAPRPSSPVRASSSASLRRHRRSDVDDVDDAIRELNTIIEERRAIGALTGLSSPPLAGSHTPAIAPSMKMHVRSETLSDIGSAFSVPLVSTPLPPRTSSASTPADAQRYGSGGARAHSVRMEYFTAEDVEVATATQDERTAPSKQHTPKRSFSRISAWVRNLQLSPLSPPPTISSPPPSQTTTPFYQCNPASAHPDGPPPATPKNHRRIPTADSTPASLPDLTPSSSTTELAEGASSRLDTPATVAARSRAASCATPGGGRRAGGTGRKRVNTDELKELEGGLDALRGPPPPYSEALEVVPAGGPPEGVSPVSPSRVGMAF